MTSAVPNARIEEWLAHQDFLRRTLRGLLGNEADVQDALQDTWTGLLERPASAPTEARAWLTRVTRNRALSHLRARTRRTAHEGAVQARPESESPSDSTERLEGLQRVGQAILALDEPYRSVVLLRYEQDLDVTAIARKLGRSPGTVRSQLTRAHEVLRQKLDREFGERERWALLAAPLALKSGLSVVPLAALALALASGAGLGLWWWNGRAAQPLSATALAAASAPAREPAPVVAPPTREPATREPIAAPGTLTVEPPAPEPLTAPATTERLLPPAELLDRSHYDDFMRATFSFEHGLRDDPGYKLAHNDWDIQFQRGRFDVRLGVDDGSVVADLGTRDPLALDGVTLAGIELGKWASVEPGHVYFLRSLDRNTDLACLVVVREHEVGRRCVLDWYATDGTGRAQGSFADDGVGETLVDSLTRLRGEACAQNGTLARPEALLQARMGAGGGNENRVHLDGQLNRIEVLEPERLDLGGEISIQEPARAHLEGGSIPDGRAFVVTSATWSGRALGDSNGRGLFKLVVGGETLVEVESSPDPILGNWSGAIVLQPGDESSTYLGLANSSAGEARLFGHFAEAAAARSWGLNAGFLVTEAPAPEMEPVLTAPRVLLQARAAHEGGNPVSLTLHGKTSIFVDRIEAQLLDFSRPPEDRDEALVHWEGGKVPEGQAFVVTRVSWWSATYSDSSHSRFVLTVAGEELARIEGASDPRQDLWSGRLVVLPGEESRTSLEVGFYAMGEALLTGHFEPAPR